MFILRTYLQDEISAKLKIKKIYYIYINKINLITFITFYDNLIIINKNEINKIYLSNNSMDNKYVIYSITFFNIFIT